MSIYTPEKIEVLLFSFFQNHVAILQCIFFYLKTKSFINGLQCAIFDNVSICTAMKTKGNLSKIKHVKIEV
jgi:hypothetical protein